MTDGFNNMIKRLCRMLMMVFFGIAGYQIAMLAIGGSSIHAARLHYVEFMGKFYVGGGKNYRPFSRRRELRWKKE
jgi:vacuolar-type H+-ATPase subunit I/STV1